MPKGRILALDIGKKRTGVAVSDEEQIIANPYLVIETRGKRDWARQIRQLITKEEPVEIVIGLPLNQYGEEGRDAENILEYKALLLKHITVPVLEWDERFTTVQAERSLIEADVRRDKRKGLIDKVAAALILQAYLDSKSTRPSQEYMEEVYTEEEYIEEE